MSRHWEEECSSAKLATTGLRISLAQSARMAAGGNLEQASFSTRRGAPVMGVRRQAGVAVALYKPGRGAGQARTPQERLPGRAGRSLGREVNLVRQLVEGDGSAGRRVRQTRKERPRLAQPLAAWTPMVTSEAERPSAQSRWGFRWAPSSPRSARSVFAGTRQRTGPRAWRFVRLSGEDHHSSGSGRLCCRLRCLRGGVRPVRSSSDIVPRRQSPGRIARVPRLTVVSSPRLSAGATGLSRA